MTLLFGLLYTISSDPTAPAAVETAGDDTIGVFWAVMPPLPILALIAAAMVVIVPIALVSQGVRNDRRFGTDRR